MLIPGYGNVDMSLATFQGRSQRFGDMGGSAVCTETDMVGTDSDSGFRRPIIGLVLSSVDCRIERRPRDESKRNSFHHLIKSKCLFDVG